MAQDYEGKLVSEEEVAKDLGFSDVFEMRRWHTEMGRKVSEVGAKLKTAESDRDNFQWHGKRMYALLNKIEIDLDGELSAGHKKKLQEAIRVVTGRGVDWDHEFDDWFKEESI